MVTLLLVDDNAPLRELLEEALQRYGFHVIAAHGPMEAIDAVRQHNGAIDLAVVDVILPKMRCCDCVSELRTARPSLKLLYMSGFPPDEARRRGGITDGGAFLMKPFTPAALLEAVRHALNS